MSLRSGLRFKSAIQREDFWTGLLCLSPTLVITIVFTFFPVLFSLYLSFHRWSILKPEKPFIGLDNYTRMMVDAEFWQSLQNTVAFTVGVVGIETPIALLLALALSRNLRGVSLYRAAYFTPAVTSTIAVAVVWSWAFNPQYGFINQGLEFLGIAGPGWLVDPAWAMPALIIMSVWKNAGYHMVIFLAGLQAIPEVFYEAASIDGAGGWHKFWHVTWPLLIPTTGFVLITNVIFSFQVFGPVYVMTAGGPMRATTVIVYYLYQRAFQFLEMGYASAIAWVAFLIILFFTVIQFRYTRKGVEI